MPDAYTDSLDEPIKSRQNAFLFFTTKNTNLNSLFLIFLRDLRGKFLYLLFIFSALPMPLCHGPTPKKHIGCSCTTVAGAGA